MTIQYKLNKEQTQMLAGAWSKALPTIQEQCRQAKSLLENNLPTTCDPRLDQLIRRVRELDLEKSQLEVVTALHCKNKLEGQ